MPALQAASFPLADLSEDGGLVTERERREAETIAAEQAAKARASARLKAELAAAAAVLVAAQMRGATPDVFRTLVRRMLGEIVPSARTVLATVLASALAMGHRHAGAAGTPGPLDNDAAIHAVLEQVIATTDERTGERLDRAIALALSLPMTSADDVLAVIATSRSAVLGQEADASWVVHRAVALGVAEVAAEDGRNVVWVAERDACLHCLAYSGHVVSPGAPFPPSLTYGDKPLKPYGVLVAPPLHPHCRCALEETDLEPGTVEKALAREAARSVARGWSDFASEPARFRAADRLVRGAGSARLLPKSVLERAQRNVIAAAFKPRPGTSAAKAEIDRRNQARTGRRRQAR